MPPRYAYWTILIDQKPTAFRARDREELLPTFNQLRRTNQDILMKWFERGKLWDTPEQAKWAAANAPRRHEPRGREWRPGGQHRDPRAKFSQRPPKRAVTRSNPSLGRPPGNNRSAGAGKPRAVDRPAGSSDRAAGS